MPEDSECCVQLLFELVVIPLHMMEQHLLHVWMPTEENHDSKQGTQESAPRSCRKGKIINIVTSAVMSYLSFGILYNSIFHNI